MSRFSLNRPTHHARTRHQLRPRLDALEDRSLLNAGGLDTTFGSGRIVLTSFPPLLKGYHGTGGSAAAVQIQSDGKIVAAGVGLHDFAVARYNTNGSLDPTFGSGGKVVTLFNQQNGCSAAGLAIQPDGKIVVVGNTPVTAGSTTYDVFAIARYNTNGTLDSSFGPNGNGLVTTNVLGGALAMGVVIQPDGKIDVVGMATASGSTTRQCALVRYNPNGTLDTTFGKGGIMTPTLIPGASQALEGVAVETVNETTEIVVMGVATSPARGAVARFNLDGSLDTSFGSGGVANLGILAPGFVGLSVAIQPDGKIIDSGEFVNSQGIKDVAVARLNINGSLDSTFDPGGPNPGVAVVAGTDGGFANGVAIQSDGKIVAAGLGPNSQMVLARLNGADGSLDTTFGTNGVVLDSLTGGAYAKSLALQSDGKIVTAGPASGGTDGYFAVVRFLNQAPTTTTLASSANPSVSGQSVTFTATISTTGTTSPTGTVQFLDGSTSLGTGTLSTANGVTTATFTTTTLAVGTHWITAVYGGDSNDMGSTSAVVNQVVNSSSSTPLVITSPQPVTLMTAIAPTSPSPLLAPLVLGDPGFLDTIVSAKRRHATPISPWIGSSDR